jgi:Mn-dependent DtxR family transcriptional regulator
MEELRKRIVETAKDFYASGTVIKAKDIADLMDVPMPRVRANLGKLYRDNLLKKAKGGFVVVE